MAMTVSGKIKRINEDFYSIISEIDHNIEVILTAVNDCFAEE